MRSQQPKWKHLPRHSTCSDIPQNKREIRRSTWYSVHTYVHMYVTRPMEYSQTWGQYGIGGWVVWPGQHYILALRIFVRSINTWTTRGFFATSWKWLWSGVGQIQRGDKGMLLQIGFLVFDLPPLPPFPTTSNQSDSCSANICMYHPTLSPWRDRFSCFSMPVFPRCVPGNFFLLFRLLIYVNNLKNHCIFSTLTKLCKKYQMV